MDSLRQGWNEICTKVGTRRLGAGPGILRIQQGFQEAQSNRTHANQARPKHQWRVHPDLDGYATVLIE